MENNKGICIVKEEILNSPIRKKLIEDLNLPYKNTIKEPLQEVVELIKSIESNKEEPLKIVVLGEVKSGKSSLVNSLIGGDISEVDVLEATSSIIEIVYSNMPYTKTYKDITKVGLNIDYLKKINIVDTPGLKSITINNEEKTLNYIKNADLILFVIDATHLGQEDVIEALDLISEYKNNIIGIVNKCDLLSSDKEEIIDYIKDEYGIYIDEFFMISSYLEYQEKVLPKVKIKNTDLVVSNYNDLKYEFNRLNDYINYLIKNYKEEKNSSIKSSLDRIIHKDIVCHNDYLKTLCVLCDELLRYNKLLQNKSDYISAKMDFEIKDWIDRIFFSDEIQKIKLNIDLAKLYINEEYINELVNKKKIELDNLFFNEWSQCLKEISNEMDDDIKRYINDITYKNEYIDTQSFKLEKNQATINELLAVVGTGAVLGATSGTVVSMYSAILGASATSTTISAALMTYCPPLLIAGTISGAVGKVIYDKVQDDKKSKELLNDIDTFIENLKYKISENLKDIYENYSIEINYTTLEILKNIKGIQTNKHEIEDTIKDINIYIDKLKTYIH